ncbi:MAG TPA: hypothetical protein VJ912_01735, partial [Candidatus Nanoarchaeia archaeon]|nr:hypothetical protein [Candidatus Nanoarchaeia archaeon]
FGEISKEETENFCEYLNRKLDSEFMGQEQQKMNYIDFIDNQEDKQIITVPKNYNLNKLRY